MKLELQIAKFKMSRVSEKKKKLLKLKLFVKITLRSDIGAFRRISSKQQHWGDKQAHFDAKSS